jgi:hypothetical protein
MNYDRSKSYVLMPSKEVARLAQETIDWIDAQREDEKKKHIDWCRVKLTKQLNSWWHLWWKRNPTEQEVMIEANDHHYWTQSSLDDIDALYGNSANIALELLNASKHVDEVYVNAEELWAISR